MGERGNGGPGPCRSGSAAGRPFRRTDCAIRFREKLPSTKHALNRTVDRIMDLAGECGCIEEQRADVEIALREALANAIIHGNGFETAKQVFVRCYGVPGGGLLILVRDQGDGFEPDDVPDPRDGHRMHLQHGRGLLLMRELMDHVEYRRAGREVLLYKTFA